MAASLWKLCNSNLNSKIVSTNFCGSVRHGHHMRGKPPGVARCLQQRLDELNYKDPELHFRVDIGFPQPPESKGIQLKKRLEVLKANRTSPELESKARNRKLLIDLNEAREVSKKTSGHLHVKTIADHYGVFQHLFGDAYFFPRVPLNITFNSEDVDIPVYNGNIIKPKSAKKHPSVSFESDDKSLWTLILTNPDGHLTKSNSEYVHWFIGNIPGGNVQKGETIVQYLQPFPPKGTGYHRHVFVLYKQNEKMDFSQFKKEGPCFNLNDRTFSTLDFYRERQDVITPAGLAFFQSDWDATLKEFYHNSLEMKEPHFEYDFPPPYIRPQARFPLRQPFNLYMDKYRDPKQIHKEFLVRKLKEVHPFKPNKPPVPFPYAQYFTGYVPSWLKLEIRKSRMKWGRINDIE